MAVITDDEAVVWLLSHDCDAWTVVSNIYHGRQSSSTGGPQYVAQHILYPVTRHSLYNDGRPTSTSPHIETSTADTGIVIFIKIPPILKTPIN